MINSGMLYCKVFTGRVRHSPGGRDDGQPTRMCMVSDRFSQISNKEKGATFYRLVPMTSGEITELNNETEEIEKLKDLAAKYPHVIQTLKEPK